MVNIIPIETLRELFISYQSQFYNKNKMYDLIAQSDQSQAIKRGSYDEHILKNFTIKNDCLIMKTDKIIKIENRIVYLKEKIDRREIYGDNFKPHYFQQQLEVAVNNWLRETKYKFKQQE